MKIRILPRHIQGADHSAQNSPVARAIREATQTTKEVHVWYGHIRFRDASGETIYKAPPECDHADRTYSTTGHLEPMEFELTRERITEHQPNP